MACRWEKYFEEDYLVEGKKLFQNGAVKIQSEHNRSCHAAVEGNHVFVDQDEMMCCSCECETMQEDNMFCEHVAAVLYALEASEVTIQSMDENQLINNVDATQIKNMLLQILKEDQKWKTTFYGKTFKDINIQIFKNQIEDLFDVGFIDYDHGPDFTEKVCDYLSCQIQSLIDAKHFGLAFELTWNIFLRIEKLEIDDSCDETGSMMDGCISTFFDILNKCDIKLHGKIYQTCLKNYKHVEWYTQEFINKLILFPYTDENILLSKDEFFLKRIVESAQKKDEDNLAKWVVERIKVLKQLNQPQTQIDAIFKKYWNLEKVRRFCIQNMIEAEEFEKVIPVLIEAKKDFDEPSYYSKLLISIYEKKKNEAQYEAELWKSALEYGGVDVETYRKLKALYTDDYWKVEREKIFRILGDSILILDLYAEDMMLDEMMNYIEKYDDLIPLERCEALLKPVFSDRLLKKYEIEVVKEVKESRSRGEYRRIANHLRHILKYEGGKDTVKRLITAWRVEYARRPAMMDELRDFFWLITN